MSRRDEMSRLLVTIRGSRRQGDITELVGMNQAKVSRLERGEGPPLNGEEAAAYAAALGATAAQTTRLVELAEAKTAVRSVPRAVVLRNKDAIQARITAYVRNSRVIRSYTTDAIPAALQTRAWTEAMLAGEGDANPGDEWWSARSQHVELLDDPDRQWYFLLTEGALRWIVGSRRVQAAEVRHILELGQRDHINVAVLDLATPKPFVAAYGFHAYGDHAAELGSELGPAFVEHPDDLAYLRTRFDRIWLHASRDENGRKDATALLERIARTLGR